MWSGRHVSNLQGYSWRAFAFLCLNLTYARFQFWLDQELLLEPGHSSPVDNFERLKPPAGRSSLAASFRWLALLFLLFISHSSIIYECQVPPRWTLLGARILLSSFSHTLSSATVLCAREYFHHRIINIKAVTVMPNTHTPPSPVDPSTVGPRARALTASINQAGTKASEADRAIKTLTVDNVASTPVRPGVCRLMGVVEGPG